MRFFETQVGANIVCYSGSQNQSARRVLSRTPGLLITPEAGDRGILCFHEPDIASFLSVVNVHFQVDNHVIYWVMRRELSEVNVHFHVDNHDVKWVLRQECECFFYILMCSVFMLVVIFLVA